MEISMKVKLQLPVVPNFIIIVSNVEISRSEGPDKIPVEQLTSEQLEAIATEWTNELFKKAGKKRVLVK